MICNVCKATFPDDATKCPYCGTINISGATLAYNQKFEDITDDLAQVPKAQEEIYKKTFFARNAYWLKYLGIATLICIISIIALYLNWQNSLVITESDNYLKPKIIWELEAYPLLDEYYAAGDIDAIVAFDDALSYNGEYPRTPDNWAHCDFIEVYREYCKYKPFLVGYAQGEAVTRGNYSYMVCFYLTQRIEACNNTQITYTESDTLLIDGYLAEFALFFEESIGLTEQELLSIYDAVLAENNYFSASGCYDYLEVYF